MNKLKLVIFDCDGVMFDSKDANKYYYNHILEHFGYPPMDADEWEYVHAHNVMDSIDHIFRHYSPDDIEKAHAYRKTISYDPYLKLMSIEPDLIEFLKFLKPEFHTAISTNRTTTLPSIMKIYGLTPYFGKVVTALDVERPKPHADALLAILDHFNCPVEQAIYIGDSMVDKKHVDTVGMRLIAFKNPDLPADYHVGSFMEIPNLPIF
jgi:beta-phosphoglucomutase-like phosphatase (HAD superfamily)